MPAPPRGTRNHRCACSIPGETENNHCACPTREGRGKLEFTPSIKPKLRSLRRKEGAAFYGRLRSPLPPHEEGVLIVLMKLGLPLSYESEIHRFSRSVASDAMELAQ
jgi:hypothetical protein